MIQPSIRREKQGDRKAVCRKPYKVLMQIDDDMVKQGLLDFEKLAGPRRVLGPYWLANSQALSECGFFACRGRFPHSETMWARQRRVKH
jgi:hypothetical protein